MNEEFICTHESTYTKLTIRMLPIIFLRKHIVGTVQYAPMIP